MTADELIDEMTTATAVGSGFSYPIGSINALKVSPKKPDWNLIQVRYQYNKHSNYLMHVGLPGFIDSKSAEHAVDELSRRGYYAQAVVKTQGIERVIYEQGKFK